MLDITKSQEIHGVTVYSDDETTNTFFIIPNQPRFRLDDNGKPVFKFMKYRTPVPRPNGSAGGGFLVFDSEFVVPEDILAKVTAALQDQLEAQKIKLPVKIGTLTYSKGTASLQLLDGSDAAGASNPNAMVEKIHDAGKPSLFGHMVSAFTAELSQYGSTLLEQAMQGQGGVAQVIYDLYFEIRLPMITIDIYFNSSTFYSYYQSQIKTNDHWYDWLQSSSGSSTTQELLTKSNSGSVTLDFGSIQLPDADAQKKLEQSLTDWAWKSLEDGIKEMTMKDPDAVKKDDKSGDNKGDGNKGKKSDSNDDYQWTWDTTNKSVTSQKFGSFTRRFRERRPIEWHIVPQGTLPNITSLVDKDGAPIMWSAYSAIVDLNDPFFKRLRVHAHVNADWETYIVNSVDVTIEYGTGAEFMSGSFHFTKADDVFLFDNVLVGDQRTYTYYYVVNYKDSNQQFTSPKLTSDATDLTLGVNDLGILYLDVMAGDIDFNSVSLAIISLRYEGSGLAQPLEREFRMDKEHQKYNVQAVILGAPDQAIKYRVKYTLADGGTVSSDWAETNSNHLYINSPFKGTKTVSLRSTANFDSDGIDTIFVELTYNDDGNQYQKQLAIALSKSNQFFDWKFPVLDPTIANVGYSYTIKNKNGTIQDFAGVKTDKGVIMVGPKVVDFLNVTVMSDLIDFTKVKLAKVVMHYADSSANPPIDVKHDYILKAGMTPPPVFTVKLSDITKRTYDYSVTFMMQDGTSNTSPSVKSDEDVLLPAMPVAPPPPK